MNYTMHKANILDWARDYDGPLFHAALMDAPYEMEFMGRAWDNSGVAFNPETWRLIARCLHPGAFLMVCAGTINDDLISVAMRQAGLRKYHKAMAWGYGSGFPKATRIDVALDRAAGAERQVIGTHKHAPKFDAAGFEYRKKDNGYNSKERQSFDVTAPATALAADWAGYRYGGQMLKPALESILIFQKPYAGRPVANIAATGAGALWIDGGRLPTEDAWNTYTRQPNASIGTFQTGTRVTEQHPAGRWPANLVLIHSPRCDADGCADDCPARRLGEQSGESASSGGVTPRTQAFLQGVIRNGDDMRESGNRGGLGDTGTAARYFYQATWALDAADPLFYCAKASRSEREAGLDPRTVAFMRLLDDSGDEGELAEYEERISQQSRDYSVGSCPEHGTGKAAGGRYGCGCAIIRGRQHFDPMTVDDGRQTPIDNPYLRGETKRRNPHPCIKPISLTRYLATLLLPPDRYAPRRLLIPFSGTGSEMIGGVLAGWDEVVGVELDEDGMYIPVAEQRLKYWEQRRHELINPSKPITIRAAAKAPKGQIDMFMDELDPTGSYWTLAKSET